MGFKGAAYQLTLILTLLIGSVAGAVYCIAIKQYSIPFVILPLIVISIYAIFRLFTKSVRKLTFMFNAIANGDYSFKFTEHQTPVSDNLLNMALNRMRDLMLAEKENIVRMEEYYKVIINSVNTGILVTTESGNIYQSNNEAQRIFRLSILTHVSQLNRIDESLPSVFNSIQAGERKQVAFQNEVGTVNLLLHASGMMVKGKHMRIIAINEIGSELDEREVESWIKLTRVITHEIMNSITPIASLADTLSDLPDNSTQEIKRGLRTIKSTSHGLLAFVESYREFSRIPTPVPKLFYVKPLLDNIVLFNSSPRVNITIDINPEDILLHADENLIFQVLTNLVKNAVHAVQNTKNPSVRINTFVNKEDNIVIEVIDNGEGIPEDIRPHIFIPFFTTKENGSGIGLSISRQIMRLHGGTLALSTIHGQTCFILTFK